jgi:hypothetical protein
MREKKSMLFRGAALAIGTFKIKRGKNRRRFLVILNEV